MIKILIADDHAVVRQGVVAERKDGQHPAGAHLAKDEPPDQQGAGQGGSPLTYPGKCLALAQVEDGRQ
jgi:hypothetical protein